MRFLFSAIMVAALLGLGFAAYSFSAYHRSVFIEDKSVIIEPGTGGRATLEQLHAAGILPESWKILLPLALDGRYRSFKAGEYAFEGGLSPAEVIDRIARGQVVVHSVTIPEGWVVAQVRAALNAETLLTGELPANIREGSIFPDTVHFQRGQTRVSIIERQQAHMRNVLDEAWEDRADGLPYATKEEALIMASIVEEETGVPEERGRVAAVFVNRLRLGMRLQTDPTVAYGIAPGGLTRQLTLNDLKRDTPYNTYTRDGLPPGPICNPGKASIEAALNPDKVDDLYFVATGNGGHYFAKTAKEHQQNVARYRAELRRQQ